jgi:putative DNA-invertase from lambdoid prophage Rac
MRIALYTRVSSEEQTTENQLMQLEKFCQDRGYEIVDVYSENASAWSTGHQKELARLLDTLRRGGKHYDMFICWSLDRLTREGIGTLLQLFNTFARYRVKLISLKELSLTENPSEFTQLFLAQIAFYAKWESDRRSERTRAGLARVRAQGSKSGIPIGKRGPDKKPRRKAGYYNRWLVGK